MSPRQYAHPTSSEISLDRILATLGDPVRLAILRKLSDGSEHDSITLVDDIPRTTLSYHTRKLRECGLTWTRSEGRSCLISLRRADVDKKFPGLLDGIIQNA